MPIKVRGGTPIHGERSLCETCRSAHIVKGQTLEEELTVCDAIPMRAVRITFRVTQCSNYNDNRLPSYAELFEQAWILQPARNRRPAGFVRSSELVDDELPFLAKRRTSKLFSEGRD